MKFLKITGITLLSLIVIFLIIGLVAPKDLHIERSVLINASNEVVYAQVSSLGAMDKWSPWNEYDPGMKKSIEGNDGQVGAISRWEGNEKVGKGSQEIIRIEPGRRVETKLIFIEPWESESVAFVDVMDTAGQVKVTWGFDGSSPFPFNAMMLFMDMDAGVGKDFEKGLSSLKEIAEKTEAEKAALPVVEIPEGQLPDSALTSNTDTVQ